MEFVLTIVTIILILGSLPVLLKLFKGTSSSGKGGQKGQQGINRELDKAEIQRYLEDILSGNGLFPPNSFVGIEEDQMKHYISFDHRYKKIIVKKSREAEPTEYSYSDFSRIKLSYKSITHTIRNRSSEDQITRNFYYVHLIGPETITLYQSQTYPLDDFCQYENEARSIGELCAETLECNLERINGSISKPDQLNISITEKLGDFKKADILVEKNPYSIIPVREGFSIGRMKNFNLGIIALFALGMGLLIITGPKSITNLTKSISISEREAWINNMLIQFEITDSPEVYAALISKYFPLILAGLLLIIGIILLFIGAKFSIKKTPSIIPIICITKKQLFLFPKIDKNRKIKGGKVFELKHVEDIDIRHGSPNECSLRIITKSGVENLVKYKPEDLTLWLREEILDCIIKTRNEVFF